MQHPAKTPPPPEPNEKSKKAIKKPGPPRKKDNSPNPCEQSTRKLQQKKNGDKKDYKKKKDERDIPVYMRTDHKSPEQKAAYEKFVKSILDKGVEALLKEYNDQLKPYVPANLKRETFDHHPAKNRYKDVVCNDLTRVILSDGKGSDYIHANHVKGDPLFNEYICTQGPIKGTLIDFWRMILFCKTEHIIMLCEVMEAGKKKCEEYWPTTVDQKMVFGEITVTALQINSKDNHVTKTHLEIECGGKQHVVRHHQWKTWPDRHVPKSVLAIFRILQVTRHSNAPIVVHCSAGIGRTGTMVAVEMCLQALLHKHQLNMLEICKRLKDQRMHSVQVDIQYVYIAQVIIEYGKTIGYWSSPELTDGYAKFKGHYEEILTGRLPEEAKPPHQTKSDPALAKVEPPAHHQERNSHPEKLIPVVLPDAKPHTPHALPPPPPATKVPPIVTQMPSIPIPLPTPIPPPPPPPKRAPTTTAITHLSAERCPVAPAPAGPLPTASVAPALTQVPVTVAPPLQPTPPSPTPPTVVQTVCPPAVSVPATSVLQPANTQVIPVTPDPPRKPTSPATDAPTATPAPPLPATSTMQPAKTQVGAPAPTDEPPKKDPFEPEAEPPKEPPTTPPAPNKKKTSKEASVWLC